MCGRMNITDDPFAQLVSDIVGIEFSATPNPDLRPTEVVSCIGSGSQDLEQQDLFWGIKPSWAKRLIINAQAETVATKPTFRGAYQSSRVIVPISGWFEWKGEKGSKQKFLFADPDGKPLFMAGIQIGKELVTLTTSPNKQCAEYHHRMPLLLPEDTLKMWGTADPQDCMPLLTGVYDRELRIMSC